MLLEHFLRRFEAVFRHGSQYQISSGATLEQIAESEARLRIVFPEPVRRFYLACNGVQVNDPSLRILPIEVLQWSESLIVFCICDGVHRIAFRTCELNRLGQWSIVDADSNYEITDSMASFWSTHLWQWLRFRRKIWRDYWNDRLDEQLH